MVTELEIITRIADLQATVSGITKAYKTIPMRLHRDNLPAFVNFPRPSQPLTSDSLWAREKFSYEMRLYICEINLGDDQELDIYPYLNSIPALFRSKPRLELTSSGIQPLDIQSTHYGGHGSLVSRPYPDTSNAQRYYMVPFYLDVYAAFTVGTIPS